MTPKPGAAEFLAWWEATADPNWTPEMAGFSGLSEINKRLIVAGNQLMACKGFLAAWDARQPEIERLRAALEQIAESKGNGLDQRIAREALDG